MNRETVIVIDFGGQYNQLVARRVRECNVYCEIYSYKTDIEKIKSMNPKGIILTGGPNSCYEADSPTYTKELFELTVEETLAVEWTVLWLCYNCPAPLSLSEKKYRKKDERILTKNNIERIIDYYSVTYEQVRKSPLGKQIFYSKPFVITQKKREKLAVSIYLVQNTTRGQTP